jgi:tetratricopeptide (TPR) repeat protein
MEKKGNYDKAIADLNEAIRLNPSSFSAYNNRGSVWEEKSEYDKAITDYNEAL